MRSVRTSQPQGPCGIDWGNPITRGLVFAGNPATLTDAVSGQRLTPGSQGAALSPKAAGVATNGNGNFQGLTLTRTPISLSRYTVFALFASLDTGTDRAVFGFGASGASPFSWIQTGAVSPSKIRLFARDDNATQCVTEGVTTVFGDGKISAVTLAMDKTKLSSYVNGVFDASVAYTPSLFTITGFSMCSGYRFGATANASFASVFLGLVFNRALSDAEIKSLSANPWQIFAPQSRQIWVPASGGGAATVIPIGVTATGSVGTPTATGAAVALPSGVSATASAGTPLGTVNAFALPAGVSAASTVGTPIATGAALAYPAGVQAASSVGSPVAVAGGAATVVPTGVAANSSVGVPIATGAALALPAGITATASVGEPVAVTIGSGTALPEGVAAYASVGSLIATGEAWCVPGGVTAFADVGVPLAFGGVAVLPTMGRPTSDASNTGWAASTGSDLFAMLDEVTPNDADYIAATSLGAVCQVNLNPTVYPGTAAQVLKFRAKSSTGHGVIVRLKEGATTIRSMTQALTAFDAEYSITLTSGEIASITSGSLSVQLESV